MCASCGPSAAAPVARLPVEAIIATAAAAIRPPRIGILCLVNIRVPREIGGWGIGIANAWRDAVGENLPSIMMARDGPRPQGSVARRRGVASRLPKPPHRPAVVAEWQGV